IRGLRARTPTDAQDPEEVRAIVLDAFLVGARSIRNIEDVTIIPARLHTEMNRRAFAAVNDPCDERALIHDLVTEALDRKRIEPFAGGRAEATPYGTDEILE